MLNINYDKVADAVYLNIAKGKVSKSLKIKKSLVVDLDKKDQILGIEMLGFSTQHKGNLKNLKKRVADGVPVKITGGTPVTA